MEDTKNVDMQRKKNTTETRISSISIWHIKPIPLLLWMATEVVVLVVEDVVCYMPDLLYGVYRQLEWESESWCNLKLQSIDQESNKKNKQTNEETLRSN